MPLCTAQIAAQIFCPTTNNCKVPHTHQDPDQLIGEKDPPREVFWDLMDVGKTRQDKTMAKVQKSAPRSPRNTFTRPGIRARAVPICAAQMFYEY